MNSFSFTRDFAQHCDAEDSLRSFRDRFFFPQHHGKNMLYFTGNSLGLQPKAVSEAIQQELNDWAAYGVEGHFLAKNPWYSYHEPFAAHIAPIVGALPSEVVVMNQLTVNLHLLLISFYRPSGKRIKILHETKPFPSDSYAFESQAQLHGYTPEEVLVELQPREGEVSLRTEDIEEKIKELGDTLALVCIGGVNYFTGQYFQLERITKAAHAVGALCGFDLAHAAGNVPVQLHLWNVDFACWCSYKYLNSGPGGVSGIFVHEKHHTDKTLLRLAGWWGHNKNTRFQMQPGFDPIPTAEAWQLSNAPVLSMAAHRAALQLFTEAGMDALRKKSLKLTAYLAFVVGEVQASTGQVLRILTPEHPDERGCQLSIVVEGKNKEIVKQLAAEGVIVDWREPNVIRMAPVPLYNSFEDIYSFGEIFQRVLRGA
jgi:kynureninase